MIIDVIYKLVESFYGKHISMYVHDKRVNIRPTMSFKRMLSTALCVYAVRRTDLPHDTRYRTRVAITVVLPVPGMPNTRA